MDAAPVITEFLARNDAGLRDGDGRSSDWIEIYNGGDRALDLQGYRLTDDADDLSKWTFPSVTLAPDAYLVVFASGQNAEDHVDPSGNLHTNFTLERRGGYLAFVAPDDTVVSEYGSGGTDFPEQVANVSYGTSQTVTLVDSNSDATYLVPINESLDGIWTHRDFDPVANGFSSGTASMGFESRPNDRTNFNDQFQTPLPAGTHAVFARMDFHLNDASALTNLTLKMRYDNGFVAYINGVKVADENAPANPAWFSAAIDRIPIDADALNFVDFDISQHIDALVAGINVLAVHGLNYLGDDSDMLLVAELAATASDLEAAIGAPVKVGYIATPTPGSPNPPDDEVFSGFVADTTFSVHRGFFDSPQQVEIITETDGAEIYYTSDGSRPSPTNPAATLYTRPLTIAATTTLRAAGFKEDFLTANVDTQTYIFLEDVIVQSPDGEAPPGWPTRRINNQRFDYGMDPEVVNNPEFASLIRDALLDISTISIVTDRRHLFDRSTGIFVNGVRARHNNDDWERPTSVELIHPDGIEGFQIDAGVRLRGGFSRDGDNPKHAFRLLFRAEYGATKLRYPLFGEEGVDEFDNIDLRTAQVPSWSFCTADVGATNGGCQFNTMVRDVFSRDTQRAMGQPYTRSRYYHLYLNGHYWGLFQSQERPEASYAESYFGGEKDDYDVIKVEGFPHAIQATDGNLDAWRQLWNEARAGFDTDEAYYRVQGLNVDGTRNPDYPVLLDVDNLIDYMLVIFYTGDLDSPISNFGGNTITNNWFGIRDRNGEQGFRFFTHDAEWTLLNVNQNRLGPWPAGNTFNESNPQWLHQQLMENVEYRLRFADRTHKNFFHGGVLTPESALSRLQQRVDEISLAIIAESARWGDAQRARPYTKNDWLDAVSQIVDGFFPRRTQIVLRQLQRARLRGRISAPLYPDVAAPVFNQHGGLISSGFELSIDAPGEVYYTLDGSDPRKNAATIALKYTGPVTLTENTVVKARTLLDDQWSALNEASFTFPPPPLRISEIMYHPPDPSPEERAAGFGDENDFEFIELVNTSDSVTLNLEGFTVTQGIEFAFPQMALAPGQYVVVVRNQAAFDNRYGAGINIAGQYGGTPDDFKLSNGGETLRLEDASGAVIHEFAYDDAWYPQTDGEGYSLQIVDPANSDLASWRSAPNWQASTTLEGSPGSASGIARQAGDANLDGEFNQLDIVHVLQADKYLTRQPASFAEGDWNADGVFDQLDIIAALQTGSYLQGPYASLAKSDRDADVDAVFDEVGLQQLIRPV